MGTQQLLIVSALFCIGSAYAKQELSDGEAIRLVVADVKHGLKDPYSSKFTNVFIRRDRAFTSVCGEVNAKNSFGAYVGYRPFFGVVMYAPKIIKPYVMFSFIDKGDDDFDDDFAHYCLGKPLPEKQDDEINSTDEN